MIPERDNDFWLPRSPPPATSAGCNEQLDEKQQPLQCTTSTTAWSRYRSFIETMRSRGLEIDEKLVLEAMYRGGDLVYKAAAGQCALR